jgi:putative transcriptional regulator
MPLNLAQRARVATGLSQRQFAKLLGISPSVICRWETGANPSGAAATLLRVIIEYPGVVLDVLEEKTNDEETKKLPKPGREST